MKFAHLVKVCNCKHCKKTVNNFKCHISKELEPKTYK